MAVQKGVPAYRREMLCLLYSLSFSGAVLPAEREDLVDRGLVEAAGAEAVRKATPLQLCALLQALPAALFAGLLLALGILLVRFALLFGIPLVSELQYLHAHGFSGLQRPMSSSSCRRLIARLDASGLLDSRSLSAVVLPAEGEHLVDRGLVEAAGAEAVRKATPLQLCTLLQSLL